MNVMNYQKDIILDEDDLHILREIWKRSDPVELKRTNNLFYIKLLKIREKFIDDDVKESFMNVLKKIASTTKFGVKQISSVHYIEYEEESYAKLHTDLQSTLTTVTLLDVSEDLEGGHSLIQTENKSIKRFENRQIWDGTKAVDEDTIKRPQDQSLVPEIISQQVGETVTYGPKLIHGVTKVTKGRRLVFIVWFNFAPQYMVNYRGKS